jgi:4-hydroxybenzoate polyprenyltransferase
VSAIGTEYRRRVRWRDYLLLARVSNLPTVWTNVAAGLAAGRAPFDAGVVPAVSASLFYVGGMFLNDAFDAPFDAVARPDRPIPSGRVSRREAFAAGAALLVAGDLILLAAPNARPAAGAGAVLAAAIVFYDARHKNRWYGPAVMGLCRALVYVLAAAATATVAPAVLVAAGVIWLYVVALTAASKRAGPAASELVPWLLAAISLVDAAIIAFFGFPAVAAAAVVAFGATLALQRVIPGT